MLAQAGLVISGKNPEHKLVEIIELEDHPWFFGCQFHPEFKSRPLEPHPVFKSFIGASYAYRSQRDQISPDICIGGFHPLFLIGGPCVIESEDHALFMAGELKTDLR